MPAASVFSLVVTIPMASQPCVFALDIRTIGTDFRLSEKGDRASIG
jgi:hypothetical protein